MKTCVCGRDYARAQRRHCSYTRSERAPACMPIVRCCAYACGACDNYTCGQHSESLNGVLLCALCYEDFHAREYAEQGGMLETEWQAHLDAISHATHHSTTTVGDGRVPINFAAVDPAQRTMDEFLQG